MPDGNIQVGLAVKVTGIRGQAIGYGLRLGRIAGGMVFFDMDVAVWHEAEVRPCPHLEREEEDEQEYGPAMGMFELAWHGARQVKVGNGESKWFRMPPG